jgi:putative acetyltransferase
VKIEIVALREDHFAELREVLDAVARERRYLAFLAAPPAEEAFAFYRSVLAGDGTHLVATTNGHVGGWCDILPTHGESRSHVGILGIGLLPELRGHGHGAALMRAAIERAWAQGLSRIELTVRSDNTRAKKLYERFGFRVEGTNRRAFRVDDQYIDAFAMGLLREEFCA